MIPYGRQTIDDEDVSEVLDVLKSDYLTQGPMVPSFEAALANYCTAPYCTVVNSATSALHLTCLALGLKAGDLLWCSPISFVASTNCAKYCDAQVNFIDIDLQTYNISISVLTQRLEQAEREGRLPKVIVAVHMAGNSCDMKALYLLRERYGFYIVEDASHAIGGQYSGNPIGCCEYSDACIFSFHPVKIVTSAEGGAILTRSESLHSTVQRLRTHGVVRNEHNADTPPWFYEQVELGFNYRMSDLHAALGKSQLKKVDTFVQSRNQIAKAYKKVLSAECFELPYVPKGSLSAFHLFIIRLKKHKHVRDHQEIFSSLRSKGIGVQLHYIPIYRHPFYQEQPEEYFSCPNAESYYASAISLPIFPSMTSDDFDRVVLALESLVV